MGRKFRSGALSATTFAAGAIVAPLLGAAPAWAPVTLNLQKAPEQILPAAVTADKPVTVVQTSIDKHGRPVVTKHTATTKAKAVQLVRDAQNAPEAVAVELDAPVYALGVPSGSDPYRANQWDVAKVRATDAWSSSTGAGVTVAVLDTGVAASHPDLAGQVLTGKNMITGQAGNTTDSFGHGTHVAGTIAAATGNGVGVSGLAPDTKILPVKVLGDNGGGMMSDVANGITWAADNGAKVINMSLGSRGQTGAVTNAIAYARSKGAVVVAAAGNYRSYGSPISYPAADPGVIAVAATDSSDHYGSFSNAGSYVDIAAPGVGILSTVPSNGYSYYNGTSMAAPHVAALAALLLAKKPSLTPDQVEQAMESTAVDLGPAGKDVDYGYGRIDAVAALTTTGQAAPAPAPAPAPALQAVVTSDGSSQQVLYNTKVTTTFTVTVGGAPAAKRIVRLCTADKLAAERCKNATTKANGTVALSRKVTYPYTVRLVVPATKTSSATGESETYSYTVGSEVGLAVKKTSLVVSLIGAAKQVNELQQSTDGVSWTTIRTFKASSRSTLTKVPAGYLYRVIVPDVPLVVGSTSNAAQM